MPGRNRTAPPRNAGREPLAPMPTPLFVPLCRALARGPAVNVYLAQDGEKRLIGRAEVPEDCGPVYEVPLFGAASTIAERFAIATVTHLPRGGGAPAVERAVLAAPGQLVDLLPGWAPPAP